MNNLDDPRNPHPIDCPELTPVWRDDLLTPPPQPAPAPPPTLEDWAASFLRADCTAATLRSLTLPLRQPIIGPWFLQGDLGFIYGPRGLGKTWLALHLARQCAEGGQVGPWKVAQPRSVLYVDGEMAIDNLRQRDTALQPAPSDRLRFLHHEVLFETAGQCLNLAGALAQGGLLAVCRRRGYEIVFLDNLSCLFAGVKENDADSWELILPWLLELRRARIAVVFIHHAGRNGCMRGTTRREDAAFWILKLSAAGNGGGEADNGARFLARFDKNRNTTAAQCPDLEWSFTPAADPARVQVDYRFLAPLQIFRQWVADGLTCATDIADEMGITKGTVSKLARKAEREGWLVKEGRDYRLVAP